jgi:hypothetical protein
VNSLRIDITKRADGAAILCCTRADGSVCWQRQEGRQAQFFPRHDLVHYAVESALGADRGFFGLIAQGWDITDTEGKGTRGPLPAQAIFIEHLVGLIERGGIGRAPLSAAELNEQVGQLAAEGRLAAAIAVSDDTLFGMRAQIDELHEQWASVMPGGMLTLWFPPRA